MNKWVSDYSEDLFGGVVLVVAVVLLVAMGAWYVCLPIVQVDSDTKEVVAVITYDGVIHPPSYLAEKGVTKYTPEYVAPGYRPAKFGITERELKDLKE